MIFIKYLSIFNICHNIFFNNNFKMSKTLKPWTQNYTATKIIFLIQYQGY